MQFLSPNAIAVRTPLSPRPGEVDITLVFKGNQFCITNPGKFFYTGTYVTETKYIQCGMLHKY